MAATEHWGRRVLGTQLASWAELRHDTLLYAKQSYTGGATCEFPDAYVDPYPEFYARVGELAVRAKELVAALDFSAYPGLADGVKSYFDRLASIAAILEQMADNQRTGTPHSAEDMAFINRAVHIQSGCGEAVADGWYADLFLNSADSTSYDPTVADVHTQPTDEGGNMVGRVLHAGTGMPRLMVVTVDTCSGPRAYAGLVSSYFERITEGFERLNDQEWAAELSQGTPPDASWAQPIIQR